MEEPDRLPKTFEIAEAQALLSKVVPLVEQLQGLQRSIIETSDCLERAAGRLSSGNGHPIRSIKEEMEKLATHQLQLIEAFQSAFKQLEGLGCLLKDLKAGLVDFYAARNEELVFLCWKLGEDSIQYWHTLESGFSGRRPLSEW